MRQFPNRRLHGNNLNWATLAKRDFAVQHRQAPGADKVKLLSLYHRFVIALHSPDGVFETGLLGDALRRKWLQSLPAALSRTLSPVRVESKSCGIAPISCNFQSNPGGFLC